MLTSLSSLSKIKQVENKKLQLQQINKSTELQYKKRTRETLKEERQISRFVNLSVKTSLHADIKTAEIYAYCDC